MPRIGTAQELAAVPVTRHVDTVAPLTGGGSLAANLSLGLQFGVQANTAVQGNDARLSNARDWSLYDNSTLSPTEGSSLAWSATAGAFQPSNSASGFVRVGPYTSASVANPNELVLLDSTVGPWILTLPLNPPDRSRVAWKIINAPADESNTVTVACPSGAKFNRTGGPTTVSAQLLGQAAIAQYDATTTTWFVISSDVPLARTDARYAPQANPNFTGVVTVPDPTTATSAATRQFVENSVSTVKQGYLTADKSMVSTTTLISTTLVLTVTSGTWMLDGFLYWTSPYAAGVRLAFIASGVTGGASIVGPPVGQQPTGTGIGRVNYIDSGYLAFGGSYNIGGDSAGVTASPRGFIVGAGTITVQFCQSSASTSQTTLKTGSWLRAQKIL